MYIVTVSVIRLARGWRHDGAGFRANWEATFCTENGMLLALAWFFSMIAGWLLKRTVSNGMHAVQRSHSRR